MSEQTQGNTARRVSQSKRFDNALRSVDGSNRDIAEAIEDHDRLIRRHRAEAGAAMSEIFNEPRRIGQSILDKRGRKGMDLPDDLAWIRVAPVNFLRANGIGGARKPGIWFRNAGGDLRKIPEEMYFGSDRDIAKAIRRSLREHDDRLALRAAFEQQMIEMAQHQDQDRDQRECAASRQRDQVVTAAANRRIRRRRDVQCDDLPSH